MLFSEPDQVKELSSAAQSTKSIALSWKLPNGYYDEFIVNCLTTANRGRNVTTQVPKTQGLRIQ